MSGKGEGRNLSFQGLTFLPPDASVPLIHLEGSVAGSSKELLPVLAGQEPPYEEDLDWLQFVFPGDTKG